MGGRSRVLLCAVVVLVAAGCSRSNLLKDESTGTVAWTPCGSVECGSLSVPLDWSRPSGPHIRLALARLPASGRRVGVLFTNPGGPGASGIEILRSAKDFFSAPLRRSFDIVTWDPRGVGASAPVNCEPDLDAYYAVDRELTNAAAVAQNEAAAHTFDDACEKNSGGLLPYVSTAATARDLDAIRAAMGLHQISYLGFSYGTFLGATYANLFPSRVRAMVLDGAVDPALSFEASAIQQAQSFDADLEAFFAYCRSNSSCGFARGGDPAAAYADLVQTIRAEPIPGVVDGEHRTLGPGELDIGVASALYSGSDAYGELATALAKAGAGDGAKMLVLADEYTGRTAGGKYSNETAANAAVDCLDAPAPRTLSAMQQIAARAAKAAPYFGASTVWLGLPCTFWPVPAQGKVGPIHAPGVSTIVVVGARHDPATPYSWAQGLASELDGGRLLTASGTAHTSYLRSPCVTTAVDHYLTTLQPPARGTECND